MKRVVVAVLWIYTGWTAGAFFEFIASQNGSVMNPALGPLLGMAAAIVFAGDPLRKVWQRAALEHSPDRSHSFATTNGQV